MNYTDLPNLASPQLGSHIIFATDEWFASADNLIKDENPVWKEDLYTSYGKWMDGWESRRRRTAGHDWCIVKLGIPGIIRAIEVDTAFFTGNFSPKVSISGIFYATGEEPIEISQLTESRRKTSSERPSDGKMGTCASAEEFNLVNKLHSEKWTSLVDLTPLGAGYEETRRNIFECSSGMVVSHLRLNMGPDGGIARLRLYGEVSVRCDAVPHDQEIDLAAVEIGGLAISWSNRHYGHPRNLIAPGRGNCMGDGWETARQPLRPPVYTVGNDGLIVLPGCDWAILKLGLSGLISEIEVDTHFYKGNYPESCLIEGCFQPNMTVDQFNQANADGQVKWIALLPRTKLTPDVKHIFNAGSTQPIHQCGPVSHVKLTIYPDGGVMRLRLRGKKLPQSKL